MKSFDVPRALETPFQVAVTLATLARYRVAILPVVARELEFWEARAARIPDPVLRAAAAAALTEKRGKVEATAVLTAPAPRRGRRAVVRASTALQIAVDYLDNLGEEGGPDVSRRSGSRGPISGSRLAAGLRLHESLVAALTPGAEPVDWYAHHPQREDGGYLEALVATCQTAIATLPSPAALPAARRAAERCGAGQSHTHADRGAGLEAWAATLDATPGLRWWEAAAGASSSVGAHALIALAGTPGASAAEAELVAAAYDPWIGALTVLLDDYVDRDRDAQEGEHNYLDHYGDDAPARIDFLVAGARRALREVPRRGTHEAILNGVLAYYLGAPEDPGERRPAAADTTPVRVLSSALRVAG
jgi:tetraprenyl-beta-curcumene synthase